MDDEQPGPRVGENPKRKAGRYTGVPHPEHSSRSSLIHLANSLLAIDELEAALPVVEAVVRHVDAGLWVPPEVVRLCEEAIGRLGERHALCEELRLRFYRGVANSTAFMREDMIGRLIDFWLKKGQHEEIKSFDEKSVKAWRMSDHPIVQGYRALDRFVRANEEAGAVAASHVHQALEQQRERPAEGTISSSERADDDMDVDGPASVPLRRFGELLHDESAGSCDLLEAYRDLRMDVEGTGVVLKAIVGYIEADRTPPPVFLRLAFLIERASDTCRDLFESCVRGNPSNMVALELLLVLLQEEALRQVLTQGLISPTERTRLVGKVAQTDRRTDRQGQDRRGPYGLCVCCLRWMHLGALPSCRSSTRESTSSDQGVTTRVSSWPIARGLLSHPRHSSGSPQNSWSVGLGVSSVGRR
mmetsp:Transcript_34029/g.98010  ORF Transcript_34029/g.98010 Transcript_34029/m.98010 type:complete len:416 (+) Transcript_34029:106-1353(+)